METTDVATNYIIDANGTFDFHYKSLNPAEVDSPVEITFSGGTSTAFEIVSDVVGADKVHTLKIRGKAGTTTVSETITVTQTEAPCAKTVRWNATRCAGCVLELDTHAITLHEIGDEVEFQITSSDCNGNYVPSTVTWNYPLLQTVSLVKIEGTIATWKTKYIGNTIKDYDATITITQQGSCTNVDYVEVHLDYVAPPVPTCNFSITSPKTITLKNGATTAAIKINANMCEVPDGYRMDTPVWDNQLCTVSISGVDATGFYVTFNTVTAAVGTSNLTFKQTGVDNTDDIRIVVEEGLKLNTICVDYIETGVGVKGIAVTATAQYIMDEDVVVDYTVVINDQARNQSLTIPAGSKTAQRIHSGGSDVYNPGVTPISTGKYMMMADMCRYANDRNTEHDATILAQQIYIDTLMKRITDLEQRVIVIENGFNEYKGAIDTKHITR